MLHEWHRHDARWVAHTREGDVYSDTPIRGPLDENRALAAFNAHRRGGLPPTKSEVDATSFLAKGVSVETRKWFAECQRFMTEVGRSGWPAAAQSWLGRLENGLRWLRNAQRTAVGPTGERTFVYRPTPQDQAVLRHAEALIACARSGGSPDGLRRLEQAARGLR